MKKKKSLGIVFYFLSSIFICCIVLSIYLLFKHEFFIASAIGLFSIILLFVLTIEKNTARKISKDTKLDYIIDKFENKLFSEGIGTRLFMSIVGLIFIIIAFSPIIHYIVEFTQNNNIKNNGQQLTATITYKSITGYRKRRINEQDSISSNFPTYYISYVLNNVEYIYSFDSTSKFYKEGDIIDIYCLPDNPKKIYVPLENGIRYIWNNNNFSYFFYNRFYMYKKIQYIQTQKIVIFPLWINDYFLSIN